MTGSSVRFRWLGIVSLAVLLPWSGVAAVGCGAEEASAPIPVNGTAGATREAVAGSPSHTAGAATGNTGVAGGNAGGTAGAAAVEMECFSPTQNLSLAQLGSSRGCSCDPAKDADTCVKGVALMCRGGVWESVEDGPCMPTFPVAPAQHSPSSCTAAGGIPVPSPGDTLTPEEDCESGIALGIISSALSGWVEGGLCCAASTATAKPCGARAGNACGSSEYCAYVAGQHCGAADAQSLCKPRPEACDDIYEPVCGCDGKSYPSSCSAAMAGTGVNDAGSCSGGG